jgi:hypothetical protein
MRNCHACKKEVPHKLKTGRKDECLACGADLHCCMNCGFYDRSVAKHCKEPVAERVQEKAKANFCDYFSFAESRPGTAPDTGAELARKALDGLFRK